MSMKSNRLIVPLKFNANTPLTVALTTLRSQIAKGQVKGVKIKPYDRSWLKIELTTERVNLWLGYRKDRGYFIVSTKTEEPTTFFPLGLISQILLPARKPESGLDAVTSNLASALAQALLEERPDSRKLNSIIDEIPSTPGAMEVLADVSTLRSYRDSLDKLRKMLEKRDLNEGEYHAFISKNHWLLGTQYTSVLADEFRISLGSTPDLILASATGQVDIIEIKRPDEALFHPGKSSHTWRVSSYLADALAQARKYIRTLDEKRLELSEDLRSVLSKGDNRIYRPRVIILAGRSEHLDGALNDLHDLNTSSGRILVVTYDDLVAIGEATIRIFERKSQPTEAHHAQVRCGNANCSNFPAKS